MKKIIALLLAAVMAFALVACGGQQNDTNDQSSDADGVVLHMMLTGTGQWEDKLQPIVDKYYEETGVKVEFECYEHTNYFPALEAIMSTKSNSVDVIGVDAP